MYGQTVAGAPLYLCRQTTDNKHKRMKHFSRTFAFLALAGLTSLTEATAQDARLQLSVNSVGRLHSQAFFKGSTATLPSPLGLVVDNRDLGTEVRIREARTDTTSLRATTYVMERTDGSVYYIETRESDDGVALRYRIPTQTPVCIYAERTSFTFPSQTRVWYASGPFQYGFVQAYQERLTDSIRGELLAPPATFRLPGGTYAAITESNLFNFHGSVLLGTAPNRVEFGFVDNEGHLKTGRITGLPPKKYYHSVVKGHPWVVYPEGGEVTTPWRVLMLAKDLDGLVNNTLMEQVADAPDPDLFPSGRHTDWIKPGRALFTWLVSDKERMSLKTLRTYVDTASQLGIETVIVDDGWELWPERDAEANGRDKWAMLAELVDYAHRRGVDIWVWRPSSPRWGNTSDIGLAEADERADFMQRCAAIGIKGLKIDFFHTENLFTVQLMEDILKEAAKNKLMVVFHGVNKPAGESFVYPNLLAKEAVRGLECVGAENTWSPGPSWPYHNTVIPFTRWLAGAADYTPLNFRKAYSPSLTFTHQLASIYMYTSPMLILAADSEDLLNSPGRPFVEEVPVEWDETRVLPPSAIGELALMARRKGDVWYLVALNGETAKELSVTLDFLPKGTYRVTYAADQQERKSIRLEETKVKSGRKLHIRLQSGGGYLARIERVGGR